MIAKSPSPLNLSLSPPHNTFRGVPPPPSHQSPLFCGPSISNARYTILLPRYLPPNMYNSLRKLRALMILLLFLLNTSLADQPGQGQRRLIEKFSIITRDRYGDTWNGGVLSVTDVDTGEVVETFTGPENSCKYNPPEFTCERIETISLYCGSYSASTSGGSWPEERTWSIKNAAGSTVAEGAGTSIAHFSTVACMSCGFGRGSLSGTECKDCPEGKYSDVDGPGYCKVCPGGTYR